MPLPRLTDDGRSVTLDLHGLTVDRALELAVAVVGAASLYGRSTVRLIHGSSTTGRHGEERTIKTGLVRRLEQGGFAPHVVSSFQTDGALLLGLAPGAAPRSQRITLHHLS